MNEMELLKVEGLSKSYPAFTLKNVSFSLKEGRIMGFIGKNGAGKSTTLKSMLGMVHPDSGAISMFGRDFREEEGYCKQNMGIVLGGIDFYMKKKLKVITGVTKKFYPGWDEGNYEKYMRIFELDENKRVEELSAGMRVKYLLALALSHHARLLVLDEPTSGLDPVSRDELLTIFEKLVKDGKRSILFSTHITSDLEKCADDITYIKEIVKCSGKKEFLDSFQSLREPDEKELSLEEIMVKMERKNYDEEFAL